MTCCAPNAIFIPAVLQVAVFKRRPDELLLLLPPLRTLSTTLVAGLFAALCRVVLFERWSTDELPYVRRFLACFAAMIIELLVENLMVW
jgi:hypothetical protein